MGGRGQNRGRRGFFNSEVGGQRAFPGIDGELEAGLGPTEMPDPNPLPRQHIAASDCLHFLSSKLPPKASQN